MNQLSGSATGKIIKIGELQTFPSGFSKLEFVAEFTDGKYPQELKFELVKDKTNLISKFQVGQEATVHFNIQGSEYNDKHYVNLRCWKIEVGEGGSNSPEPENWDQSNNKEDEDDIPF